MPGLALRQPECQGASRPENITDMDVENFHALLGGAGLAAVGRATASLDSGAEPLAVATDVRHAFPELSPEVAAAAVTQAQLRRRARAKFGDLADRMWFTADGVEQATRAEVAAHRAARFAALTSALDRPPRVADLCCGIGADLHALVSA